MILELERVVKRFGGLTAVDEVSFAVRPGQIISLLGPSGCGKTTTLRLIAGFETPDSGKIVISGRDMQGRRPYERNVGLLFQDYALFPHMTVEENIAYGPRYRRMDKSAITRRVGELLSLTRLVGLEKRRPSQLSGGQQQRVALARALATEPELILLDEPLSALDAKLRQELRAELKEILTSVGTTAVVVTHDQEEAMSLAQHIIVMDRGRIMQQGSPTEIYAHPASKFVAEFVGRSNWFPGRLGGDLGDGVREFTTDDGIKLKVVPLDRALSGAAEVCVRPERIAFDGAEEPSGKAQNWFPARVVNAALLGALVHYVVEISGGRRLLLVDKYSGGLPVPEGKTVAVRFGAEDCIVVPSDGTPVSEPPLPRRTVI